MSSFHIAENVHHYAVWVDVLGDREIILAQEHQSRFDYTELNIICEESEHLVHLVLPKDVQKANDIVQHEALFNHTLLQELVHQSLGGREQVEILLEVVFVENLARIVTLAGKLCYFTQ